MAPQADIPGDLDKTIGGKATVEIDGEKTEDTIKDYETGEHPDQPVLFELEETGEIVNHREIIEFEKSRKRVIEEHLENAVEELEKAKEEASELEKSHRMIKVDSRKRALERTIERFKSQ
jgi:hypothetical protein